MNINVSHSRRSKYELSAIYIRHKYMIRYSFNTFFVIATLVIFKCIGNLDGLKTQRKKRDRICGIAKQCSRSYYLRLDGKRSLTIRKERTEAWQREYSIKIGNIQIKKIFMDLGKFHGLCSVALCVMIMSYMMKINIKDFFFCGTIVKHTSYMEFENTFLESLINKLDRLSNSDLLQCLNTKIITQHVAGITASSSLVNCFSRSSN